MPIHFTAQELADRRHKTCDAMIAAGFDGLLLFRQESLYYLTGYDTFGYVYFQCLFLGADGRLVLLTRAPDLRQARFTSVIEDIRIWTDEAGASPVDDLRALLDAEGCRGERLGVEWDAYGLTARLGFALRDGLAGFCRLDDASALVSRQRLVKSAAEREFVAKAAGLADLALDRAASLARPGAFEGDILAEMQATIFRGGGDDPANETIIGSGPGALMCRYFTGRRHLSPDDQLTLEFAGVFRHYHACLMRTIRIGPPPSRQLAMHQAAVDALHAAREALKPGAPIGDVFDAHARVLDGAGFREHRLNACGYSLGATFAPNWMDWPMFYHDNSVLAAPGMVFFIHIILFDSDAGLAMTTGQTVDVTAEGSVPFSKAPLDLIVK